MDLRAEIDSQYEGFVETLPEDLQSEAKGLACFLGLAPDNSIPWSQVFKHEVTLGAPALVAEAMPALAPERVRSATLAHMLAIIEAFATDRIEDQQVEDSPALRSLLSHIRKVRDRAIPRVAELGVGYAGADVRTLLSIATERRLLLKRACVAFDRYEQVSLGKQAVGFPASMALVRAVGWDSKRRDDTETLLESVWLGLQFHDDVVDWEDDLTRGGAWAVSLARHRQQERDHEMATDERISILREVRSVVFTTGVLAQMLSMAEERFRRAAEIAHELGMIRLASWAQQRKEEVSGLAEQEKMSAGYAVRAHSLAAWASEVLK